MTAIEINYRYRMNHINRGIALIINNKTFDDLSTRNGAEVDEENIKERLTHLSFEVKSFRNLKRKAMEDKIKEAAALDHSENDCFVCVILTHGEKDKVHGTDGPVEVDSLLDPFKGHRCKTLVGKPKIFFIQACRGTQLDDGTALGVQGDGDADVDMEPVPQRIPTEADFLVAYSSVSGFFSFRNKGEGSWFIQALCKALKEHGDTLDLMTIMTRVNMKVAFDFESYSTSQPYYHQKKQIPCITSMLTKDVYFPPKGN